MRKMKIPIAMGVMVLTLSACGQVGSPKEPQINADDVAKISDNENGTKETGEGTERLDDRDPAEKKDKGKSATDDDDELEALIGEYDYLPEYGTGKLTIKKSSYGYDISDYESEDSYRFLADSSNIEGVEDNKIYIKYPEQVFSDDTAIFCYYILAYGAEKIDVYYGKSSFEEAEFLYAAKKIEASNSDSSNENAYFLSADNDFYQKLACNPIDQNDIIDGEAAPLEIWQSALKKCAAWNQQIDFTGSKLGGLLSEEDDAQLQNAISLWQEYYQEEVEQNRELYGNSGMILGSMYTAMSADVLMEKCKLAAFTLLSQEYKLSGNVSFAENIAETMVKTNDSEYSPSPQSFCIEYSTDFEETLNSYSIDEKNSDELEELIGETANKIEEKFGHDFTEHTNKYLSFIHALYTIETNISEDSNLCLILKENRLKLYAIELLNIVYMV